MGCLCPTQPKENKVYPNQGKISVKNSTQEHKFEEEYADHLKEFEPLPMMDV